jgi:hypothetical protein
LPAHVLAIVLATLAEVLVVAASPAIALAPAVAVAMAVGIFHGTDDGIARGWFLLTWGLSHLVIWLVGGIAIAHGINRWLGVHPMAPLLGALAVPAAIVGLIAAGRDGTAADIIGGLHRTLGYLN